VPPLEVWPGLLRVGRVVLQRTLVKKITPAGPGLSL